MAHISIINLTVEFKVLGLNSRSLKKQIIKQASGGVISTGVDDSVTVKAINGINLEISQGDRIALVGRNGSGKSTFLRALSGIYIPNSGSIEIEGTVGTLLDPSAGMDQEATGIENIYLRGAILGMTRSEIAEKLDEIADFTELGDFLHLPVKTYSAGMYSRLGFAISTSITPEILLIDEGIGAADAAFQEKINMRANQFIERAKICVFASHNEEFLSKVTNKRLVMSNGSIYKE